MDIPDEVFFWGDEGISFLRFYLMRAGWVYAERYEVYYWGA